MLFHLLLRQALPSSQFFCGIHGAAAISRAAITRSFFLSAIVKTVVVTKLLARGDVAYGRDPYMAIDFLGFAIRVARMIDEHRDAVTVNDMGSVTNAEQVGDRLVLITAVGLFFVNQRTCIFDHARTFCDRRGGVATGGVDRGGANDETHTVLEAELGV